MICKAEIMDEAALMRVYKRIAHEIIEKNNGTKDLCLIGIRRRGVPIAEKLAENIYLAEGEKVPVGIIDITLYRDDLDVKTLDPTVNDTQIDFDVNGKTVVLVDDVLYTGRTARAALEALLKKGRPEKIQLAVIVDRGHRQMPIRADYVGKNIPTSHSEVVAVNIMEIDGKNCVELYG